MGIIGGRRIPGGPGGRARGKLNFDLNKNISRASLLLCKHNKKLHKSKTSNLKHETRMIYTQKRTRIKELTGWWDWEDVVWRGNHRCI